MSGARIESGQSDLYEREGALGQLDALLDSVADGSGRIGIVEGPAGIGKSRLIEALRQEAADREFAVLSARGSELERDFPFGVVRQLFEPALVLSDDRGRDGLLGGAAALARPVFADSPDESTSADPGFGVLHGLFWLTSNLSERGPVVLAADDLHWSDAASLRFLSFLANRIEHLPVLLAIGVRGAEEVRLAPAENEALEAIRQMPLAEIIEPAPLSPAAVASLLDSELGLTVADDVRSAAHEATGGNPFLARELAGEIAAETRAGRSVSVERIRELAPARITSRIVGRFARMAAGAEPLARAAAVLGERAEPEAVARLAEIDRSAAGALVDELVRAGFLVAGPQLRFRHPVVRSVVYDSIPDHERSAAHARAAKIVAELGGSPEQVATHLLHSMPADDPETVSALRRAASDASRRGAPDVALALLERALQEPPDHAVLVAVLFEAGVAARSLGDPTAIEKLQRALAETTDPELGTTIAATLGEALSTSGRDAEAVGILETAIAAAEEAGLSDSVARLSGVLLVLANALVETREAVRDELSDAVHRVETATSIDPVLCAHMALEYAVAIGPAERAAELGRQALEAGLIEIVTADAPPVYLATGGLWVSGRLAAGERWLTAALDEARARGSVVGYALASAFRSAARLRSGDLDGAQSDAEAGLEFGLAGSWTPVGLPVAAASLISTMIARGELEKAAGIAEQVGNAEIPPGLILNQLLRRAMAELEVARGHPEKALVLLDAISAWERQWGGATGAWCWWRLTAAEARRTCGDIDGARELAREELALARAFGAAPFLGASLRSAGALEAGPEDSLAQLGEAVDVLDASEARLELASALVSLGAGLRRSGADRDAREPLQRAREIARSRGAHAIEREALDELVAAGGRPRAPAGTELDELTPAELRVGRLAREGKTNREIAQALFVTLKTVETHLSRIYRKLEISSRSQLPARLAEPSD
ncbi:MAG: helix-turn-helix transcriptional regulator [Solirubrobacterales bacterium]